MAKPQALSNEQAKRFYDRLGAWQDTQRFHERPALADLIAHLELARAGRLIEFGCGTGRFAEELFRSAAAHKCLLCRPRSERHNDRTRTARFGGRSVIQQTIGTTHLDLPEAAFDRFISTCVFDLLSEKDIESLLAEAHRVLTNGGLLGVVSLTKGFRGLSRFVT